MPRSVFVSVAFALAMAMPVAAQDEAPASRSLRKPRGPWFGIALPPGPDADRAVVVGTRAPRPVALPAGTRAPELSGETLRADLEPSSASPLAAARRARSATASCGAASPA
jgi:hypothetical protein